MESPMTVVLPLAPSRSFGAATIDSGINNGSLVVMRSVRAAETAGDERGCRCSYGGICCFEELTIDVWMKESMHGRLHLDT
jgi:hypothetical protein